MRWQCVGCAIVRIDYEDGIRREFEIITQGVDVWHVSEFSRSPLEEDSHGQFHDEDAYVVCWHFVITQSEYLVRRPKVRLSGLAWV